MNIFCKALLTIAAITILGYEVSAQPGFEDDVDDVPIDGGITLLIAAGAAYGIKNRWALYKNKITNKQQPFFRK